MRNNMELDDLVQKIKVLVVGVIARHTDGLNRADQMFVAQEVCKLTSNRYDYDLTEDPF